MEDAATRNNSTGRQLERNLRQKDFTIAKNPSSCKFLLSFQFTTIQFLIIITFYWTFILTSWHHFFSLCFFLDKLFTLPFLLRLLRGTPWLLQNSVTLILWNMRGTKDTKIQKKNIAKWEKVFDLRLLETFNRYNFSKIQFSKIQFQQITSSPELACAREPILTNSLMYRHII